MFRSLVSLFLLVYLRLSYSIGEENLGKALNSIENRQRELASDMYSSSYRDSNDDVDSPTYLGDTEGYYGGVLEYPLQNPRANEFVSDGEEQKYYLQALNDRLLDQLEQNILHGEDVERESPEHRAQKKSFFREREISDVSDNLQNLEPELPLDETFAPRLKSTKLHSPVHRRVSLQSYDLEDGDDSGFNAVDPLWRKYDGQSLRNRDPETLDRDAVDAFMKYLASNSELYESGISNDDNDDYTRETYTNENRNHDRDRSKRYWLGSNIRKRSLNDREKLRGLSNKTLENKNATTKVNESAPVGSSFNRTAMNEKSVTEKKGQKEMPVALKSSLKPLNIKKKSIDWSNYFGVDKRQKKSSSTKATKETPKSDVLLDQYIQSYILQSVRDSAFNNRGGDYGRFPKRNYIFREQRLEEPNRQFETADDLKTAEDMIIDHVLKYTGANQGANNPETLHRYRERVINELGAAYNLEKLRNEIIGSNNNRQLRMKRQYQHTNDKRVAVKKENAELLPSERDVLKASKTIKKKFPS